MGLCSNGLDKPGPTSYSWLQYMLRSLRRYSLLVQILQIIDSSHAMDIPSDVHVVHN